MADMLVNLLKLQPPEPLVRELSDAGIAIRRALPFEITKLRSYIEHNFSAGWADEIMVGFAHKPVSVFIAIADQEIIGFAAYECTRKNFFGPMGVSKSAQRQGIGKALLLASLHGLRELDYVYAIIGGVGPVEFYRKAVGAVPIPDSDPGIYTDLLK